MTTRYLFESERLGFRRWKERDRNPFAAMSADPEVMQYFPRLLCRENADRLIDRFEAHMDEKGYTMWAVEKKEDSSFIGFIGLLEITMDINGQGFAEIGWRLDKRYWKKGFAVEGAQACLAYAFGPLDMTRVFSFTSTLNEPSQTVMKRIGMTKEGEFEHPKLEQGSPLKRHVLYRIDRE
ncbi:ribosomal-protein-alanine N-acetyltransferase [Planomicrobium stackebrandtii]|uniref:Ribosomal-protein-alanine N-acetyltransferase n=1 Tax=Planomicrobium stackebrandtii TaxID=253160 RepID=A0ABU0GPY0_9BACL|nr:GNAT family N-acetyltransferase [Planomicrobium stackebrandtii]MDQ0427406.1 ribosomal-protein-alanine N-acetyltransferase [Planomicrobium stackebrandtii]